MSRQRCLFQRNAPGFPAQETFHKVQPPRDAAPVVSFYAEYGIFTDPVPVQHQSGDPVPGRVELRLYRHTVQLIQNGKIIRPVDAAVPVPQLHTPVYDIRLFQCLPK